MALRILVVGAGLGGLAAAISIKYENPEHDVIVIESAPELAEIGAGLQLTPNATKCLQRWALDAKLEAQASCPEVFSIYRYDDAELLGKRENFGKEMFDRFKSPYWDCHRADVQICMFECAKTLGVTFIFGARVDGHDFSGPSVVLDDGRRIEGDLIVGADGLWSKTRESLLGTAIQPKPTGDLAYRILLENNKLTDPELLKITSQAQVCLWVGPECHAIYYPLKNNTVSNIVLLVPDNLPEDVRRASGDLSEMREIFQAWEPRLQGFLSRVDRIDKWKLMHLEQLPTWHNTEGTALLIGDSCHPMLPYMAQGAGSAIEDGALLGVVLAKVRNRSGVKKALESFESIRKPRSAMLQQGSMRQRYINHLSDGSEQKARDKHAISEKYSPGPDYPFYWINPIQQEQVYGYDIFEAVKDHGASL